MNAFASGSIFAHVILDLLSLVPAIELLLYLAVKYLLNIALGTT